MTIGPALASVLRSGRSDFNARFEATRRNLRDLQPESFLEFVGTRIDELATAVNSVSHDSVAETTMVAYDAALELVGQNLAGPSARMKVIDEGWRRVLTKVPHLVASAPDQIIPAVSNALYHLASVQGTRPSQWIDKMESLGPQCDTVETFLKLGQLVAWRAGLAHFRDDGISLTEELPPRLVFEALDASAYKDLSELSSDLRHNPWLEPGKGATNEPLTIVSQVGAFRGFGGLFLKPPIVAALGEHFLAKSDNDCWLITADRFGATFHRSTLKEFEGAGLQMQLPPELSIKSSILEFGGHRLDLSDFGDLTSAAANNSTLALTSALSHSITLVALL